MIIINKIEIKILNLKIFIPTLWHIYRCNDDVTNQCDNSFSSLIASHYEQLLAIFKFHQFI
jgi:hypothetical protein